ncbi:hypothetical protein PVV74_08665 [Roseovarius sp. SK2]|jgi:hypothetical protein|uniref:hypothetical protein n=1 Tax=Roseovarius TaxID=74030 RepID=UPI000CDD7141|nr:MULTISPECIES: hypothetical protein [Roseovarius]MDD9725523.1 hypothetical protein [Roseovarius sp. SK2]
MVVEVNQLPLIILLKVSDPDGHKIHTEEYRISATSYAPPIPDVGQSWNLWVDGKNWPCIVLKKTVTTSFGGNGLGTTLSIAVERTD